MSQSVKAVECEGHRERELGRDLGDNRPRRERRRHGRRVQVPAEERRNEVRRAENVEAARQHGTSDTVQNGQDPGDLGLVDAQVRAARAVLALRDEDLVGGGGSQVLCRDGPAIISSCSDGRVGGCSAGQRTGSELMLP